MTAAFFILDAVIQLSALAILVACVIHIRDAIDMMREAVFDASHPRRWITAEPPDEETLRQFKPGGFVPPMSPVKVQWHAGPHTPSSEWSVAPVELRDDDEDPA